MLRKLIVFTFTFAGFLLLAGCAENVALRYTADPQLTAVSTTLAARASMLSVGDIQDTRGTAPNFIFSTDSTSSASGYVATVQTPYLADQPIADLIHQAMVTGLDSVNSNVVGSNSNLVLSGDLLNIFTQARFKNLTDILVDRTQITITMNMRLLDRKTGSVVWYQQISGSGIIKEGIGHKWVRVGFNNALNNLIANMLSSSSFQAALRNYSHG